MVPLRVGFLLFGLVWKLGSIDNVTYHAQGMLIHQMVLCTYVSCTCVTSCNFTFSMISRPWHECGETDRRRLCTSIVSSLQVRLIFTEKFVKMLMLCILLRCVPNKHIHLCVENMMFRRAHLCISGMLWHILPLLKQLQLPCFGFCT